VVTPSPEATPRSIATPHTQQTARPAAPRHEPQRPARTWLPLPKHAPAPSTREAPDTAAAGHEDSEPAPTHELGISPEAPLPTTRRELVPNAFEPILPAPPSTARHVMPEPPAQKAEPRASFAYRGASASFSVAQVRGALGSSTILRTLTRGTAQVEACVGPNIGALQAAPPPAHLSLTIDEMGHVRQVSVAKHPVPGLGACVQAALSKLRSDQKPDVGTVTADVEISFRAR